MIPEKVAEISILLNTR